VANRTSKVTTLKVRDGAEEHDYLWDRPQLGSMPSGPAHYRDLPIIGGERGGYENVSLAWEALSMMSLGNLLLAGYLAEDMMADDRISAVIDTRLEALASLPLEVAPRGDKLKAEKRAEQLTDEWSSWVPESELKKMLFWGRMLNLGLGEIIWDTTSKPGYWKPRVKAWDPRNCFWRWDTRSFWVTTHDGITELRPGDGHWILYCPHGYARGWMRSLIRPLTSPFLRRSFSYRDWSRFSEKHGLPILKLAVPQQATEEDKELMIRAIAHLNSEGIVECAQPEDGTKGYDVTLIEPTSQSWQCFQNAVGKEEENIASLVLGGNLGTSAKTGGSYALGNVQDRIRLDRLESDAKSMGLCLEEQMVLPWSVYNYDDAELCPHVRWSTKAPEDRAKMASTLDAAGAALLKWRASGVNVDRVEYAKRFDLALDSKEPTMDPVPVPAAAGSTPAKDTAPESDDAAGNSENEDKAP
jgi:phage gp29-like protein